MKKGYLVFSNAVYTDNVYWPAVSILFEHFRPTHIEHREWENGKWYIYGESPLFDIVKEGESIPQYDGVFTRKEDGTYNLVINRI